MGLPKLERCCFIFDLKTGNLIIGTLNAFLSFILTVVMIVIAATIGSLESNSEALGEEDVEQQAALTGAYIMSIILVLMFLFKFIFDVLFVYGVATERANIIKGYFVVWFVFILLSMFTFFLNANHYSGSTICFELFYISLNLYAILLCHSFYKELNSREVV